MSLDTFFTRFRLITRAPNGMARLRDLILQMAASGKLADPTTSQQERESLLADISQIQEQTLSPRELQELKQIPRPDDNATGTVCLGRIARLISGQHLTPSEYTSTPDGIPYITGPAEFGAEHPKPAKWTLQERAVAENLDVLITVKGSGVGKTNQVNCKKLAISRQLMAVRSLGRLRPDYLWLCLRAAESKFQAAKTGIAIPGIGRRDVLALLVYLPSEEEQNRIVAKVDELMGLCDRLESQLAERAQLLPLLSRANHDRFVQEPTEENLKAIFPLQSVHACEALRASILTLAVTGALATQDSSSVDASTYLDGSTRLRPDPSRVLRSLPQNWLWARVDETGYVQLGRQRAPKYHRGANMRPYLRVQNVYEDRLDFTDVKQMEFSSSDFAAYQLASGDILLNEGQSRELVGRPAIFKGEIDDVCFQNTLIRYRHKEFVIPEFALLVFRSYMRSGRFQDNAKQTTNIAHLGAGRFSAMEFPLPPREEQERIVKKCTSMLAVVEKLEALWHEKLETQSKMASGIVAVLSRSSELEPTSMKPPEVEVVTSLKRIKKPPKNAIAPLTELLAAQDLSAKVLWQRSGLEIDRFYAQLKTEIANGWIAEPEPATVREVEVA